MHEARKDVRAFSDSVSLPLLNNFDHSHDESCLSYDCFSAYCCVWQHSSTSSNSNRYFFFVPSSSNSNRYFVVFPSYLEEVGLEVNEEDSESCEAEVVCRN